LTNPKTARASPFLFSKEAWNPGGSVLKGKPYSIFFENQYSKAEMLKSPRHSGQEARDSFNNFQEE